MEKFFAVSGWVHKDWFGRIVIDECPSDELHLRHASANQETNKPGCRYLLEQFFDRGTNGAGEIADSFMMNKKGTLTVQFRFEEDESSGSIEDAVKKYAESDHAA
jgi:hypothetical protein